jgi:mannose-1-phosphate guanylyltransferase/mannose-6-phosphate isomerase
MLSHFNKYADDILESCKSTLKESFEKLKLNINININRKINNSIIHLDDSFKICRSQSIDYAIMEKLCINNESCITIPFNAFWNDIGSYASLYDQLAMDTKDENKNVIKSEGDVNLINSKNCYVDSYKPIVGLIGMENVVIVDTEDALLVCNKDETQDVKKVFTFLKEANREEAFLHRKAYRPWGYYCNIYETKGYKMKKIVVYPGKRLSLQSHNFRSEHWVIVSGKGKVQLGYEEIILEKDKSIYIPVKELHRIENIGEDLLEFTETQIGDYLGEDDIVRYEDDFGRVG